MNKIAFLIPYFGKLPSYFDFFLHSCSYNQEYDFIFFTDLPIEEKANIKVRKMTLPDFNLLATNKLGFEISITKPYKFCDLRPAFGKIFEDYISTYTFWGSVDIDVVVGKLSSFISPELLKEYDVYSGVTYYLSGSLFLFRNTEKMNMLYTKSKDYKKVFQSKESFVFDECGPVWHELMQGKDLFSLNSETESITHVLLREQKQGNVQIKFTSDILERVEGEKVYFKEGTIQMGQRHYASLHFIYLKTHYYFIIPSWSSIPSTYFIDKQGMHTMDQEVLWRYILKGNVYSIIGKKAANMFRRIKELDFIPSKRKR